MLQTKKNLLKNKDNKCQTDLKVSTKNEKNINRKNLNVKKDNKPLYYLLENGPKLRLDIIVFIEIGYTGPRAYERGYGYYNNKKYYHYEDNCYYPAFKILQKYNGFISYKYFYIENGFSNVDEATSWGKKQCNLMNKFYKFEWKITGECFGHVEDLKTKR